MNRLIEYEQGNNIFNCHLIWTDKNINNAENKFYQEHMRNLFSNNVVFVKSEEELMHKIEENDRVSYACVIGTSIAYNLPVNFYESFILFSGQISPHIELFLMKPKMMSIIDQYNPELLQQFSQFILSQTFLESIFKPKKTVQSPQYSHSDSSASFKFLLINELFKNQMEKVTEEKVMNELKSLIGDQAFREMDKLAQAKQQLLNCQFNLFQKILFYYTTDFLYNKFNQALSQENYHQIKYSLKLLFQGYSIQNQKPSNKQRLGTQKYFYRGISFDETNKAIYDETINNLQNWGVIYWNSLTSITKDKKTAETFMVQKYKILFEIEFDDQNPHPFIEFTDPMYGSKIKSDDFISKYDESEVLLFPQFCFELVKADMIKKNQYLIEIKQVQKNNDFSMELEEDKRSQFWNEAIDRHLKKRLNIITTFLQSRIKFVIKHFQLITTNHDLHQVVQFETYNYFDQLMILLGYVFRDNAINEYKNMIKQQLEFNFAITIELLYNWLSTINKITKIVIEDFISALKGCCKIEDSKTQLAYLWNQFVTIVNIFPDDTVGEHLTQRLESADGNFVLNQLSKSLKIPNIIGVGTSTMLSAISLYQIISDDTLTKLETLEETLKLATKSAVFMATSSAGIEVGSAFGPVGMIVGSTVGGIIGALLGKAQDNLTKFNFDIIFTQLQYTIIKNGIVESIGIPPSIKNITNLKNKAKTVVLLVNSENLIYWKAWKTRNSGWHGIGRYIGPRPEQKELTFHLLGLLQSQIDEETIVEDLFSQNQPRYKIICYAKKKIKLSHFE